jgi:hypothetical protein
MAADTLIEKGNPISGDLTAEIRACREVDQPMLIFGAPGVGKSDQVRAAGDEDDLVIDLRLNSLEAIDMRGLPIIKKDENKNPVSVEWVRPEFLPGEKGIVVEGRRYTKGILFLDELNTAQPSVQNPALQLVLDRRIGQHTLPRSWYICAAANRAEDRAHTYPLSAALLDRFAIYDYSPDHVTWTKWAMQNDVHPDVIGYISFSPSSLLSPRKDEYSASANPRSWCYVSKRLKAGQNAMNQIRACVGSQASEFCAYLKVCANLPNIARLVDGKESFTENRRDISVAYAVANAVASHLLEHDNPEKVLDNCVKVISGISPEPASLFYRRIMLSAPQKLKTALFHSKAVAAWIKENNDILQGAITLA